jgi:hypothetical protein
VNEVHNNPGFLTWMAAGYTAHTLLIDPLGSCGGKVEADSCARGVPTLGEELCVDEYVNLASLVIREHPGKVTLGRLTTDRLSLDANVAEGTRNIVRVPNAGGIDNTRRVTETGSVEIRNGKVEGQLVEYLGKHFLIELSVYLAPTKWDLGNCANAWSRRDPDATQRGDNATASRLSKVKP